MPRAKNRAKQPERIQFAMDFQFLMRNIRRKLKAEKRGGDQALHQELRKHFSRVMKEVERTPRQNSLKRFQWQVFEEVSNHFWPQSVRAADRPPGTYQKSKPFINMSAFTALHTDALSFEQLVEFIQCNGDTPFRWPRKSKERRRRMRQMTEASNRPGDDESNPIMLSPIPNTSLRPTPSRLTPNASARSPLEAQLTHKNRSPSARSVWDDDVNMAQAPRLEEAWMTSITEVRSPTLSFACRSGWDLNQKETWIPAAGYELEDCLTIDEAAELQLQEPVCLGAVSFTRVSEKDTEAFMSRFLSCEGAPTVEIDGIQG